MKSKLILIALLLFTQVSFSQNAKTILDNASSAFSKAGGINASFTILQQDAKAKNTYTQDGTASIKGNNFKFEVPDGITWFDGKTQWVMAKGSDEVNISNPTGEELAAISPTALLGMYKKGFTLNYKGQFTDMGKSVDRVEMIPQKKSEISKFEVNINKQNNQITSITIHNTDSTKTILQIKKYQTGVNLPDSTFLFNKKDYPEIDIIDLR